MTLIALSPRQPHLVDADARGKRAFELWLPVAGWPGYYVSNFGRVLGKKGIMAQTPNHAGYMRVRLYCSATGKKPTIRVHRMVAEAFIENPDALPEVHHKDHDVSNNAAANLEWVTRQENIDYRYGEERHGPVEDCDDIPY